MKPDHLLVLAGGFGTRLRAAVPELPKPLAPVAGRPYLAYLIDHWAAQGIVRMTFLLHHQAPLIEQFLMEKKTSDSLRHCELDTLTEAVPLGTGGAIAYAVRELGLEESFLVANADTWLGESLNRLGDAQAPAMSVVHVDNTERYGRVEIAGHKISTFTEKKNSVGPGWINAGMYRLDANLFRDWDGRPFSIEDEVFPSLASTGELTAVPLHTEFIDIGVPADYFRFCRWIESQKAGTL